MDSSQVIVGGDALILLAIHLRASRLNPRRAIRFKVLSLLVMESQSTDFAVGRGNSGRQKSLNSRFSRQFSGTRSKKHVSLYLGLLSDLSYERTQEFLSPLSSRLT